MKRFLALVLVGSMLIALPVMAAESPSAATVATQSSQSSDDNGGSGDPVADAAAVEGKTVNEYLNNAVEDVPGLPEQLPTSQGGGVILNGVPTNYKIELTKPAKADVTFAKAVAENLPGAKVLSVVGTRSNALGDFSSAYVNYKIKGVKAGANVVCFGLINGQLVQVPVLFVVDDHVVVDMPGLGKLMFYELPAANAATAAPEATA
ncbi:MAG: hypothetical protein K5870_10960 [Lachnospiraceae bacterium]|nr:hypothetical protein [Lachnospiraceae bacterium]